MMLSLPSMPRAECASSTRVWKDHSFFELQLTSSSLLQRSAAEALFGYSRGEVVRQNVRMLMPNDVAEHHGQFTQTFLIVISAHSLVLSDQYIKNYQQTKNAKIIGIGRVVQAKHKDGHLFPVRLTVTESVQESGDVIYTGRRPIIRHCLSMISCRDSGTLTKADVAPPPASSSTSGVMRYHINTVLLHSLL